MPIESTRARAERSRIERREVTGLATHPVCAFFRRSNFSRVVMNIFDFNLPAATRDALIDAADIITPEPKRAAAISRTFVAGGGPAAAFALINLGDLRMAGNRRAGFAAAEKHFRAALAISDTIGEAHAGLAIAIDRQRGRSAEVEASYARAVELMEADAQRARRRWRQRRRNSRIKEDFSERAVEATALRYLVVCAACLCELRHERGAGATESHRPIAVRLGREERRGPRRRIRHGSWHVGEFPLGMLARPRAHWTRGCGVAGPTPCGERRTDLG